MNTATPQAPIDVYIDMLGWRPYFRAVFGDAGLLVLFARHEPHEAADGVQEHVAEEECGWKERERGD